MTRGALSIGSAIVGGVVTAAVLLLSRGLGHEPHLPPSRYLPTTVRDLLDKRMGRHANDMIAITHAVILLDFKAAADGAARVASEANLARPLSNDATDLNALLPPRFFELQDQLRASAARVSTAAQAEDVEQLAQAYSEMTRACVACHGVYLRGQEAPKRTP